MATVTYPKKGKKGSRPGKVFKEMQQRTHPHGDNAVGQPGRDVGERTVGTKPNPLPPMDNRAYNVYTKSGAKSYREDGDRGAMPQSRYRSRNP